MELSTQVRSRQPSAGHVYPRVYRIRLGWRLFLSGLGLIGVVFGVFGIWYFATGHETTDRGEIAAMIAIFGSFAAVGVYLVFSMLRSKITLRSEQLEVRGALLSRRMRTEEIAGWRTIPQRDMPPNLVLIPRPGRGRKLPINESFALDDWFYEWLDQFPDLDAKDQSRSREEVLSKAELGGSRDERRESLRQGKRVAGIFTFVTLAVGAWGLFDPEPYRLVIAILAALPLLALILAMRSHGLFRLDDQRNDAHPDLAVPFVVPAVVMAGRAMLDFDFIGWTRLGMISITIGIILVAAVAVCDSSLRAKPGMLLVFLFYTSAYGLGAGLEANFLFDHSSPKTFTVSVLDRYISDGDRTDYKLELSPWGPIKERDTVSVSKQLYQKLQPGSRVCVDLRKGALRIPWYIVDLCP